LRLRIFEALLAHLLDRLADARDGRLLVALRVRPLQELAEVVHRRVVALRREACFAHAEHRDRITRSLAQRPDVRLDGVLGLLVLHLFLGARDELVGLLRAAEVQLTEFDDPLAPVLIESLVVADAGHRGPRDEVLLETREDVVLRLALVLLDEIVEVFEVDAVAVLVLVVADEVDESPAPRVVVAGIAAGLEVRDHVREHVALFVHLEQLLEATLRDLVRNHRAVRQQDRAFHEARDALVDPGGDHRLRHIAQELVRCFVEERLPQVVHRASDRALVVRRDVVVHRTEEAADVR
jgi:hypothetical protein